MTTDQLTQSILDHIHNHEAFYALSSEEVVFALLQCQKLKMMEHNANLKDKAKNATFKKPSVAEIATYAKSINANLDAQHFWDWYESKNWYVGKNKMKDWQAALRNWNRSNTQSEPTKKLSPHQF